MAFGVFICIVVTILAFWSSGILRQENSVIDYESDSESPAGGPAASPACAAAVKSGDGLLAYTKNCLGFPKEAMDCVFQYIQKREKDPFPIAVECTPNMPEYVKEILRKLLGFMNKIAEVESRCRRDHSKECANELLVIKGKHDEVMNTYAAIRQELLGPAKEANTKFHLLVNKMANSF